MSKPFSTYNAHIDNYDLADTSDSEETVLSDAAVKTARMTTRDPLTAGRVFSGLADRLWPQSTMFLFMHCHCCSYLWQY